MKMMLSAFLMIFVPMVCSCKTGAGSSGFLVSDGKSADDPADLALRLAQKHEIHGLGFAIISNRIVSKTGFVSCCDQKAPPTSAPIFQAASLGKPVFAYGILKLVKEGRLDLDRPLLSYLPSGYLHRQNPFALHKEPKTDLVTAPDLGTVTARMVLTHTSGLPNWSNENLTFTFPPGTSWGYSGEGFMLLQQVAERMTGEQVDQLMHRLVFDPLKMTSTEYRWSAAVADRLVPGISASGQPHQLRFPDPIVPSSLYTTAGDYAKFITALLADPEILRLTTTTPVTVDGRLGLEWGLGWGLERQGDELNLWHWGSNPGYRSFVMVSTKTGNGIVILTDNERGLIVAEPLVNAVLPGHHNAFRFYMLR
jgi:CubicO group peptidase (beta-lactamase class C family)